MFAKEPAAPMFNPLGLQLKVIVVSWPRDWTKGAVDAKTNLMADSFLRVAWGWLAPP
jgi:hypothetical protein